MALVWAGSQVTKVFRVGGAVLLAPLADRTLDAACKRMKLRSKQEAFAVLASLLLGSTLALFGLQVGCLSRVHSLLAYVFHEGHICARTSVQSRDGQYVCTIPERARAQCHCALHHAELASVACVPAAVPVQLPLPPCSFLHFVAAPDIIPRSGLFAIQTGGGDWPAVSTCRVCWQASSICPARWLPVAMAGAGHHNCSCRV